MSAVVGWRSRRRSAWRITSISIVLLIAGIASAASLNAWNFTRAFDNQIVKIPSAFPPEADRPPVLKGAAAKAENVLLLGSDSWSGVSNSLANIRQQRSDTIMVVHIPANRKNAYVMSIPRDSWLEIPRHGKEKIDAALSWGGVPLAVETIENLLGARIDHVVLIDFQGFKGLTDALGGVDIDNPIGFRSSLLKGHYFAQGKLHLNGTQALAFVREIYAFTDGDFQRERNQQLLLKARMSVFLNEATLVSPERLNHLLTVVAPYVAVDSGVDLGYLTRLGAELRTITVDDITQFTMPTGGVGTSADGQSIVNVDWAKYEAVQRGFKTDTLDTYQPEVQTIQRVG